MRAIVLIGCFGWASVALAQGMTVEAPKAPGAAEKPKLWPRVGGHIGFAIPIATITNDATTVIGRDFVQVGITPGITVRFSEHWMMDFEFIGSPIWIRGGAGMPDRVTTTWVVDPGLLYAFPRKWTVGLRVAVIIGEGQPFNYGLVPIVVRGFRVSDKINFFLEYDMPFFVNSVPGRTTVSFTPCQIQTGLGF